MLTAAGGDVREILRNVLLPKPVRDPYPWYARLRQEHPALRTDQGLWIFSRYQDVAQILGDPAFAAKDAAWFDAHLPFWRDHPGMLAFLSCMVFQNDQHHLRLRRAMAPAFAPARLRHLAQVTQVSVAERLGTLEDRPDPVDLHQHYSLPVVRDTICALVGVPADSGPELYELVQPLLGLLDPLPSEATIRRADRSAGVLRPLLEDLVLQRRRRPRDDLAGHVSILRDDEAVSALMLALAAGFDTAVTLVDHCLAAPATGTHRTVLESLRHDPPLQLVTRITRCAVVVGEITLEPGEEVMALLGSAHRDPERYPDPDHFDPDRNTVPLLAFGGGAHYCLGARLARTIAECAVPALQQRFPGTSRSAGPRTARRITLAGWTSLPMRLAPADER
ncbi:cytochrome P450 [Kineosporia babensis]|uniref:Cytochrome P450 n=1 Tax=Kineosporia babensis TaxID=499548 RepID=A0A9X1NMV1_9ACTN|nr:cytochrome P450 [Kineosporia babensis]MCD5316026.1 cytochrome P450 [Kineosporia babensis]